MQSIDNPQLQLAHDFVQYTNANVFLTGKAGTGKTTFLKNLRYNSMKRMIVVAPTGVAAINAGGVTIHSFFQMPFGPIIPTSLTGRTDYREDSSQSPMSFQKFSRDKINIIKSLDLLVIDEISMVRADLLDGIDEVLRRFKNRNKPFGGVQLLMIGDLQQLAPVIKDEEWNILRKYYDSVFFFSSHALRKTNHVNIELKHIYRQSDQAFISLLNKVRDNKLDSATLEELNKRYIPNFSLDADDGYITLTTHNYQANSINDTKLGKLPGNAKKFSATVQGEFPEYSYPTEIELTLKKGAQVMFVKNDISREKLFYNGKIGVITRLDDSVIMVKCQDDEEEISVTPMEWHNCRYSIDEETKEIKEIVLGTFTQHPLKLAWAITIHKSQGLTFERAIIDANAAFAHGQVYVALSRCKTLEGLVLSSQISTQSVKTDHTVSAFNRNVEENQPGNEVLSEMRQAYQQQLLLELIDFVPLVYRLNYVLKLVQEHRQSLHISVVDAFERMNTSISNELMSVSGKFKIQLYQLFSVSGNLEENAALQDRVKKACAYFEEKTDEHVGQVLHDLSIDIDNKTIRKSILDAVGRLKEECAIKLSSFQVCKDGFTVSKFLETRAKAAIETPELKSSVKKKESVSTSGHSHPKLYASLRAWRDSLAKELNLPVYMILPTKTMVDLETYLPVSSKELGEIKGFGKKKVKQFGVKILEIIKEYRLEQKMEVPAGVFHEEQLEMEEEPKPEKIQSKQESLNQFNSGKSIAEIALSRDMAETTIEGHLSYYVAIGELDASEIVSPEKIEKISQYFLATESKLLGPAKAALGDDFSYGELRIVLKHLEFKGLIGIN